MNNFDLKNFLTENKLTTNSRIDEGEKVDLYKPLPKLGKPLKDIGMEINDKLKGMGYQTKLVNDMNQFSDILEKNEDKKMATLYYQTYQSGNSMLEIRVHQNNADDLKKIVGSYNFPEENGGYQGAFVNGGLVRATIHASERKE
jgi:hypothetical protein